jgi:hypothetical protein
MGGKLYELHGGATLEERLVPLWCLQGTLLQKFRNKWPKSLPPMWLMKSRISFEEEK